MAKKKADGRKPSVRVETVFSKLTLKDWAQICRVRWTKVTWKLIGYLIVGEGSAEINQACDGAWSRVMQANRLLIKYRVPFRIKSSDELSNYVQINRVIGKAA